MNFLKRTVGFILFFTAIHFQSDAQSLVLCESYDSKGNTSGNAATWEIKSTGGSVYIVYNQSAVLPAGSWYLYLDYDWDKAGTYQAYETLEIEPERGQNWFVYDYNFTETGKYKASVMYNGTELATTYFVINYQPGTFTETSGEKVDTYYYEGSKILFCTSMDTEGNPIGEATSFSMRRTGSVDVAVYISNSGKPFKSNKFLVDVYYADSNLKFDSFTVDVQPDWDYLKFNETFVSTGTYIFDFYTEDNVFINTSGVLTITE